MVYPKSRGIPFNFSHEQELSPEAPENQAPLSLIIDYELLLGNRGIPLELSNRNIRLTTLSI